MALAFILNGCYGQSSKNNTNTITIPQITSKDNLNDTAYHQGILVVEGSCVYIKETHNQSKFLPVFSVKDVSWDNQENALKIDSKLYKNGELVAFGGGQPFSIKLENYNWIIKSNPSCDLTKGMIIHEFITPKL